MEFYVYRIQDDSQKASNVTADDLQGEAASLEGIMWTLNNRDYQMATQPWHDSQSITRIVRLKAVVFNNDLPYEEWQGQFGPWVDFSQGKCVSSDCASTWKKYGFTVGCLKWSPYMGGVSYGNRTQWYSLPGSCPSRSFVDKTPSCRNQAPGGQCFSPNGTKDCTWNLEPAGEVRLDELEDVTGPTFGASQEDLSFGMSFRNDRSDSIQDAGKVDQLRKLFREKYPKTELPEPTCNSQNAQCQYHQKCRGLIGNCCPYDNGVFLACCSGEAEGDVVV